MKRTEPTRSLLQGGAYTVSWNTDIRETFQRARDTAGDFAAAYRLLAKHHPTQYSFKRATEIAWRKA